MPNRKRRRWRLRLKTEFTQPVTVANGVYRRTFQPGEDTWHKSQQARMLLATGYFERVSA
jgi:hypothetical protein